MSSQFELNEFAELLGDTKPSDFRIGKVISIQGTTLTLGIPNGEGGLFSVANVNYLNNFVPTAGAVCWYRNMNGSILVFGQQESVADGPRTKLVTLLGAQTSWALNGTKTLLRDITSVNIVIVRWKASNTFHDITCFPGNENRLAIAKRGTSTAYVVEGVVSFSGTIATLSTAVTQKTSDYSKTDPDPSVLPYQIFGLL